MNKHYLKATAALLGFVAFFALLGWAGDIDYTDQCILRMSYEEYHTIRSLLTQQYGHEPSERQIAHWWASHHKE